MYALRFPRTKMALLVAAFIVASSPVVAPHARADELAEFLFWNEMGNATDQAVRSYADYQRERQLWRDKIAASKAQLERCGGCALARAELEKWQGIENQFQHVAGSAFAAVGMPPIVGKWLGINIPPTPGLSPAERAKQCEIVRRPWVAQRSDFCQKKVDEYLSCMRSIQQTTGVCNPRAAKQPGEVCYWASKFYQPCADGNDQAVDLERRAQEARAAGRIIPEYVNDGIVKIVFYGEVPNDFVPRLPPVETAHKVIDNKGTQQLYFRMQKSSHGTLRQIVIKPFHWDDIAPNSRCFQPGAVTEEIGLRICEDLEEMSFLHHPLLLACYYTSGERALMPDAMYWYGARPAAVAEPRNYLKRSSNHPFSMIGDARADCPATLEEANLLRSRFRSTLASLGVQELPADVSLRSNWDAQIRAEREARLKAERAEKLGWFPLVGVFKATFATDWVNRRRGGYSIPAPLKSSAGECAVAKIDERRFELDCREPSTTSVLAGLASRSAGNAAPAARGPIRKFKASAVIEEGYFVVHWGPELSIPYAVGTCSSALCLTGSRHPSSDGGLARESVTGELVRKRDLATWGSGQLLEELPELSRLRSHRVTLQGKGVTSLETLAAMSDNEIDALPVSFRNLREAAREFLVARDSPAVTISGLWSGRYTCSEGSGALQMRLEDAGDGYVWGTVTLSPSSENPPIPSGPQARTGGSFYLGGTKHDHRWRIELQPGPAINSPHGARGLGVCGRYAPTKQSGANSSTIRMWGRLGSAHSGCNGEFEVQRMKAAAPLSRLPSQLERRLRSYHRSVPRLSSACDRPLPDPAAHVAQADDPNLFNRPQAPSAQLPFGRTIPQEQPTD